MLRLSGLTIVHEDIPKMTDGSADDINDSTGESVLKSSVLNLLNKKQKFAWIFITSMMV